MSEELAPCPFCGASAFTSEHQYDTGHIEFDAMCAEPYCSCQLIEDTREQVIKAWNTRPIEDALRARIAELEAVQRPIPFNERKPDDRQLVMAWDAKRHKWLWHVYLSWVTFPRDAMLTHWLPMPPAPEEVTA